MIYRSHRWTIREPSDRWLRQGLYERASQSRSTVENTEASVNKSEEIENESQPDGQ